MPNNKAKVDSESMCRAIKPLEDMLTTYQYELGSPTISARDYKNTFTGGPYHGKYSLHVYSLSEHKGIYSTDITLTVRLWDGKKKIIDYSERSKSRKSGSETVTPMVRDDRVRTTLLRLASRSWLHQGNDE